MRVAVLWQVAVTAVAALLGGWFLGLAGALSALAGGAVSVVPGLIAAVLATRRPARSAEGMLFFAARAEGLRIVLIFVLLWVALSSYPMIVVPVFFATFALTVLIFSIAFVVRDDI